MRTPWRLICFTLAIATPVCAAPVGAPALGLLEIYQRAAGNDPTIRAARASDEAVRNVRRQTVGALLPSVTFTGQKADQVEDVKTTGIGFPGRTRFDSEQYAFTLRQPVLRFDLFTRTAQARSELRSADARYLAAQQALIVDIAERYFGVLAAQDNLEFAHMEEAAAAQQLRQVKARSAAGAATITDVYEIEAGHDLAVAQEIAASASLASAEQALRERAGAIEADLRRLKPVMPLTAPDGDAGQWATLAETNNAGVVGARFATAAAAREIYRQRSGHLPTLDLLASQSNTQSGGRFGDSEVDNRSVGLQLAVPIFSGGQVQFRSMEAAARRDEARESEEKTRRAAVRAATDAHRAVVSGISRIKALERSVASTEAAMKAVEAGTRAGTRLQVDLLIAQRVHFRAQRDLQVERYNYVVNSLRLKESVGTLSAADVETVSAWLE
jgi:outer membrane protein